MNKEIKEIDKDEVCDLDPNKICDSCCKCLDLNKDYASIKITKIIMEAEKEGEDK